MASLRDALARLRDGAAAQRRAMAAVKGTVSSLYADYADLCAAAEDSYKGDLDAALQASKDDADYPMPPEVVGWLEDAVRGTAEELASASPGPSAFLGSSLCHVPPMAAGAASLSSCFSGCEALVTAGPLDVTGAATTGYLFNGCLALRAAELTGRCESASANFMFYNCGLLEVVDLTAVTFRSAPAQRMLSGCVSLRRAALAPGSTFSNCYAMLSNCAALEAVENLDTGAMGGSLYAAFNGCSSLSIDFENLSGGVTNLQSAFHMSGLRSVRVSTAGVAAGSMAHLADACPSLTSVELVGGTAMATSAYAMFDGCASLASVSGLDLSGLKIKFGVNDVTHEMGLGRLLAGCPVLTDCRLSGTLYKGGLDLRGAPLLDAPSLLSFAAALYDWDADPDGVETSDTEFVVYMSPAQQEALRAYDLGGGEGESAYLSALERGWQIVN